MKKMTKMFILAALATPLILYTIRRIQSRKMRSKIADEGFETATDILYPDKQGSFSKLQGWTSTASIAIVGLSHSIYKGYIDQSFASAKLFTLVTRPKNSCPGFFLFPPYKIMINPYTVLR